MRLRTAGNRCDSMAEIVRAISGVLPDGGTVCDLFSGSARVGHALKKKGFAFVGPTTMYALMEAIGMVDTHLLTSHRRGTSGIGPNS